MLLSNYVTNCHNKYYIILRTVLLLKCILVSGLHLIGSTCDCFKPFQTRLRKVSRRSNPTMWNCQDLRGEVHSIQKVDVNLRLYAS